MRLIGGFRFLTGVMLFAVAVAAALGILTGLANAATSKQGTIDVGGTKRTYTIYLPNGHDPSRRHPIVMALHGGMGDGSRIAHQSGLPGYVDRYGIIAIFPNAGGQQWNDGRETTRSGRDDVAFLVKLVQQVADQSGGDPKRVLVTGASNGGMMAQRLACDASDVFTAVAVVVANLPTGLVNRCQPKRPVPIMFFNADTDPFMPWAGGDIRTGRFRGVGGKVISTQKTIDFWERVNGCQNEQTQSLPDRANDGTRVKLHTFSCSGAPVLLYEIQGGGHTWPGGPAAERAMVQQIIGPTSRDISATQLMLDWFGKLGG